MELMDNGDEVSKPWYQSKTIQGILIMILGWLFGGGEATWTEAVHNILMGVGGVLAIYGRAKASGGLQWRRG